MKKSFAINWNVCNFTSSINVQSNVNSIIHFKDTPRRSVATLSLGTVVDRASEPGAIRIMDTPEIWVQVYNYPNYLVSNLGRVKKGDKLIAATPNRGGYLTVYLQGTERRDRRYLHKVVWDSFNDAKSVSYSLTVDHIDNDRTNNKLSNLQLLTNRANVSKAMIGRKRTSKYTGVYYRPGKNKWVACYKIKDKQFQIGTFNSEDEAHDAYQLTISKLTA